VNVKGTGILEMD
jgi:jouberin